MNSDCITNRQFFLVLYPSKFVVINRTESAVSITELLTEEDTCSESVELFGEADGCDK